MMGRVQTRSSRKPEDSYPLKGKGKEALLSHSAPSIRVRQKSVSAVEKDQRDEHISCTGPMEPEEKGNFRDLGIVEASNTDFSYVRKNSQEELFLVQPDKVRGERAKEDTGTLATVTRVCEAEDFIKFEKKKKINSAITVNDPAKENRSPEKIQVLTEEEDIKAQTISTSIGVKQDSLILLKASETMVIEPRSKLENVTSIFDDECDREVNEIISSGRSSPSASVKNMSPSSCNKDDGGRLSSDSLGDLPLLEGCFPKECTNCGKIKEEIKNLRKQFTENFQILKKNIMSASDVVKGYREKCQDLEKQSREHASLQAQLEASYEETAKIRQQLKKANDSVESQAKKISRFEKEINFSRAQVEELEGKLAEEESKVTKLSVAMGGSDTSHENGSLKREVKEQTAAAEKLRKSNTALEKKIAKLNETIKEIRETARAKVKEAKASGTHKEVTKLKERLRRSQNTVSQLRKQVKDLKTKTAATRTKARNSKKIVLPEKLINPDPTPKTDASSSSSDSEAEESQENETTSSDSSSSSEDDNETEKLPEPSKPPLATPPSKSIRPTFPFMHQFAFLSAISPLPPSPALSRRYQGNGLEADQGLQSDPHSVGDVKDQPLTEKDKRCHRSSDVDPRIMEEWVESTASSETVGKRGSHGACRGSLSDSEESDREGSGSSNSGHKSGTEIPGVSARTSNETLSEDDSDQEPLQSKTVDGELNKQCPSLDTQYNSLFGGCISDSGSSDEESSECDTTCLEKKNSNTPTEDTQQLEVALVQHEISDHEEHIHSFRCCEVEKDLDTKESCCEHDHFASSWRSSSLEDSKPHGNEVTRNKSEMDVDVACRSSLSPESSSSSVFDVSRWSKSSFDGNKAVNFKDKDEVAGQDLVHKTAPSCNGATRKDKKVPRKVQEVKDDNLLLRTTVSHNEAAVSRESGSSCQQEIDFMQDSLVKGSGHESIAQEVANSVEVVSRSTIDSEQSSLVKSGYSLSRFTQCRKNQDTSNGDGILTSAVHDESRSSRNLPFQLMEDPLNSGAMGQLPTSSPGSIATVARVTSCDHSTTGTPSIRGIAKADSSLLPDAGVEAEAACETAEGALPIPRSSPDNHCNNPLNIVSPNLRSTSTSPFEALSCSIASRESQAVLSEVSSYAWTERSLDTVQSGLLLSFASIASSSLPSDASRSPRARTDNEVLSVVANAHSVSPIQLLSSTVAISPLPATPTYASAAVSPIPTTPVALASCLEASVSTSISPLGVLPVRSCSVLSPLPCSPPIRNTVSPLSTTPIRDAVLSPLPCSPITHQGIESEMIEGSREVLGLSSRSQPSPPILKDNVSREAEPDIFKPVAISRRSARALNFDNEDSCTETVMQLSHDRGSQLRLLVDSHKERKISAFSETKRMTPEAESTTPMPGKTKNEIFCTEVGDETLPGTSGADSSKSSNSVATNEGDCKLPIPPCRPSTLEHDIQVGNTVDGVGVTKRHLLTESSDGDMDLSESNSLKAGVKPSGPAVPRSQETIRSSKRPSSKRISKPRKSSEWEGLKTNEVIGHHLSALGKPKALRSSPFDNSLDGHLGNPKSQGAAKTLASGQQCNTGSLEVRCADTYVSESSDSTTKAFDCPRLNCASDSSMTERRETCEVTPAVGDVGVAPRTVSVTWETTKVPVTKQKSPNCNNLEFNVGGKEAVKRSSTNQELDKNCSSSKEQDDLALAQAVSNKIFQPLDKEPSSVEKDCSHCEVESSAKPPQIGLENQGRETSLEFDNSKTDALLQSKLGCRPTTRARLKVLEMMAPGKVNPANPIGRKRRVPVNERTKNRSLSTKRTDSPTLLSNTPCKSPSACETLSSSSCDGGMTSDVVKAQESRVSGTLPQDVDMKVELEGVKALNASVLAVAAAQACSLSNGIKRSTQPVKSDRILRSCKRLRREQLDSERRGEPFKKDVTLVTKTGTISSSNGEGLDQSSKGVRLDSKASARDLAAQINGRPRSLPSLSDSNQKGNTLLGTMPAQMSTAAKATNSQASKTKSAKERAIEFLKLQKALIDTNSQAEVSTQKTDVKEPKVGFKRPLNGRRLKATISTTVSKTLQDDSVKPHSQSGAVRTDRLSDHSTSLSGEKTGAIKKNAEKDQGTPKNDSVQNLDDSSNTTPKKKKRLQRDIKTTSDTAVQFYPSNEKRDAFQASRQSTAEKEKGAMVEHTIPCVHASVIPGTQPAPLCELPMRLRSTDELQYAKDCLTKLINGEATAAMVARRFRMAGCISLPRTLATAVIASLKAAKERVLSIDYKTMLEDCDFESNGVCKECNQPIYAKHNYLNMWDSLDTQARSDLVEVKFFGIGGALLFPVMTCTEKALLQVVKETSKEGRMRDLPLVLMRLLPRCITGDPSLPAYKTTSMCRLLAALCAITGQLPRLRTFIYDMAYSYKQKTSIPRLLLSILLVWPEVFQHYHCVNCQERDKSLLSYTIKFVALKQAVHSRVKILTVLESVFNMKRPKDTSFEEEVDNCSKRVLAMVTDDYEQTDMKAFQTLKSLDLAVGYLTPESLQHRIADLCTKLSPSASGRDMKLCIQRLLLLAIYCKHAIQIKRSKLEPVLEICQQLLGVFREGNSHALARTVDLLLIVSPRHEQFVSDLLQTTGMCQNPGLVPRTVFSQLKAFLTMIRQ